MKKIYQTDPWLEPFKGAIDARSKRLEAEIANIQGKAPRLADAVNNHLYYGLHKTADGWVLREWAPNATAIYIKGDARMGPQCHPHLAHRGIQ